MATFDPSAIDRREFFKDGLAMAGGLAAFVFGSSQSRAADAGLEASQKLAALPIQKYRDLFIARADVFAWPAKYLEKSAAVTQVVETIGEYNQTIKELAQTYSELGRDRGDSKIEAAQLNLYFKLLKSGLFSDLTQSYSEANYKDLVLYRLPREMAKFGYLVETSLKDLAWSKDHKQVLAAEYYFTLIPVTAPTFEQVKVRGQAFNRATFSAVEAVPINQSIITQHGHVLASLQVFELQRSNFQRILNGAAKTLLAIGREQKLINKHLESISDPVERRKRALLIGTCLAIEGGKSALASTDTVAEYILAEHEDRHASDMHSGRIRSVLEDVKDLDRSSLVNFNLSSSVRFEASAILGDLCNARFGSFGIATVMDACFTFKTGASRVGHGPAAEWVINQAALPIIISNATDNGFVIDHTSSVSAEDQVITQLYKLANAPGLQHLIENVSLPALFPAYYNAKSEQRQPNRK